MPTATALLRSQTLSGGAGTLAVVSGTSLSPVPARGLTAPVAARSPLSDVPLGASLFSCAAVLTRLASRIARCTDAQPEIIRLASKIWIFPRPLRRDIIKAAYPLKAQYRRAKEGTRFHSQSTVNVLPSRIFATIFR